MNLTKRMNYHSSLPYYSSLLYHSKEWIRKQNWSIIRRNHKLTQKEVALICGCTQPMISLFEQNKVRPSSNVLLFYITLKLGDLNAY